MGSSAVISNKLVLTTEMEGVYCAVRTKSLIFDNLRFFKVASNSYFFFKLRKCIFQVKITGREVVTYITLGYLNVQIIRTYARIRNYTAV